MTTLIKYIIAIFIGITVGFIGGFQGIAGGFYITALALATGIVHNHRSAAGTTLLSILFPISAGAVYEYYQTGDIDIPVAIIIAVFYTIFATYGARFNAKFSEQSVLYSLSILLGFTSIYFGYSAYTYHKKIKK